MGYFEGQRGGIKSKELRTLFSIANCAISFDFVSSFGPDSLLHLLKQSI